MNRDAAPAYYAVIPANVRYDNELSPMAKLMYGEITSLANKTGCCFATNQYFSELYDISAIQVSRIINILIQKKYLEVEMEPGNKRKLYIAPINKNIDTLLTKMLRPINENVKTPINKNVKHNNTSINNKINSTPPSKIKYAENVSMTEEEYKKLREQFGEKNCHTAITILDNYKGASGRKYKSDYRAILSWVIRRMKKDGEFKEIPKQEPEDEEMIERMKRMGAL